MLKLNSKRILRQINPVKRVSFASLFLLIVYSTPSSSADEFSFALVGDNPYSGTTYDKYIRLINQVNKTADIEWVIHLGDVKGGGEDCSDEELSRRFQLNQRFEPAYIVTPGDNDWLDCKREAAGGFNEYERLEIFRNLFYPRPGFSTGGNPIPVSQQSEDNEFFEFVENAMWEHESVVFATVHTVALTAPATDPAEKQRRDNAGASWIEAAFEKAIASNAKGVFLAMQADPWQIWGLPAIARRACGSCIDPRPSLAWLYPVLRKQSLAFGKPVVLAVGDTHIFRVDKPLYTDRNQLVENFTRVEVFGNPSVNWVNVLVEPDQPWVFSFREQLVE